MTVNGNNIFSEPSWASSWYKSIAGNSRFSAPLLKDSPLSIKHRRRPTPFTDFIEYPAQDIAYDIDMDSMVRASDDLGLKLIDRIFELKEWHGIDLRHLKKDTKFGALLLGSIKGKFLYTVKDDDMVWEIILPDRFEDYLASLKKERKSRYIYYLNRIEKQKGYGFFFVRDGLELYWKRFLDLHRERIETKGSETLLLDPVFEKFYENLAKYHLENGTLRLACLQLNSRIEGMLLGVEKYGTFYYLNSGFSGNISKFSPGVVMPLLCIRYSIAGGLKKFNFLGGEDKYKKDMGAIGHPTSRITVYKNPLAAFSEILFGKVFSLCRRK